MKLISNLQFSINSVFELYKLQGRKYYSLSLLVSILAAILSIILTLGIYFVYKLLDGPEVFESHDLMGIFSMSPVIAIPIALSLALYAIMIQKHMGDPDYKPTFGDFFAAVGGKNIGRFFLLSVVGILANILLQYLRTYHASNPNGGMEELMNLFSGSDSPFVHWLKSLLILVIMFLPYVLAFVLMNLHMREQGRISISLKNVFWSFLLLFFIFDVCQAQLFNLLNMHVLGLLQVLPFMERWLPLILFIPVLIFFFGIFAMPIASGMIFPFLYESKEEGKPAALESNDLLDR